MRVITIIAAGLAVAAALSGCSTYGRQPRLSEAAIAPAQLRPGDTAVISIKVENDRFDIVERVRAAVREDPRMKFDLRDDGQPPDAVAGDGVWTLPVDVPFIAPPGEFTLDITAYDAGGNPIPVKGPEGAVTPLTQTAVFRVIQAGAEAPAAEDDSSAEGATQPREE